MKKLSKKALVFILIGLILVGMNFIPVKGDLTPAGRNTIGIVIVMLICFISGVLPLGVVSISLMMLMYLTGACDFNTAISGFAAGPVLFMLCAAAMSDAVSASPLSNRILHFMLSRFGKSVKSILLALMFATAFISAFISNVPTCAMFVTIGLSMLKLYDDENERNQTGKAFMIAIPVSAMIGGIMTPVGSSPNLVAIETLKNITGYNITFVEWCCYGTPIALVLIPIAWFVISKVFPPYELDKDKFKAFIESTKVAHAPDKKEIELIVIFLGMIILWIASSWIKSINLFAVAIVGVMIMFMPGIELLDWKKFTQTTSWDAFFVVPFVISLGTAIGKNNISTIIVDSVFSAGVNLPVNALVFALCIFIMLMMLILPNGGAAITVMAAPVTAMALQFDINPVILITAMCFCATNCYLLPIESVPLIAYSQGYFKMGEMPKATGVVLLVLALLITFWNPLISGILG